MGPVHPGRRLLLTTVRRSDDHIDLARAALAIAWEDLGDVDVDTCLERLDALVHHTRKHAVLRGSYTAQARQIVDYLHHVEGFTGNVHDYDDPSNSYLPHVLDRRVGLPITLSLVTLYVGWQLGMPFAPAALPGHFMVRCDVPDGVFFVDLFFGRVLDTYQCRSFLQHQIGHSIADPARFPVPTRRQVLARMLRNLKGSYFRREEFELALAATERILLLEPRSGPDLRDRGLLRARLGGLHAALLDLDRYAEIEPMAVDIDLIRKHARLLADTIGQRN